MHGMGTIVNCAAILLGGSVGLLFGSLIPERVRGTLMHALGLAAFSIGLGGFITAAITVTPTGLESRYTMLVIISLVIGTIIGCLVGIEEWLNSLGEKLNRRFSKSDGSSNKFAQGFFNASLLYCVGAMAIVGSLNDGLTGDASTLYAKSILDGVAAIIFSSGFGVGALFSILPVGIYQGSITLLATLLQPLLTEMVIQQMCAVGYLLIVLIGTNLMDISKIKVGNMLPALFIPLVYNVLLKLF
ncbi:MAG: DUF554 domain-containing protein [Firmicutes bacterium]|nr:DUF554 domain-containing protein [Bacillota bacterium]